jgi:hypothetical protein
MLCPNYECLHTESVHTQKGCMMSRCDCKETIDSILSTIFPNLSTHLPEDVWPVERLYPLVPIPQFR